jgi:antitoxin (DNA-binding transcriptional repressor) of toxin-antitoxin stability system
MGGDNKKSVGIKELKKRASQIIAGVQQTGQAVSITRNNQQVAMITPIPSDPYERLVAAGLLRPGPKPRPLSELRLKGHKADASPAIRAIIDDREED